MGEFRLQFVSGELKPADFNRSDIQYKDAYVGNATSFTVRNLTPLKSYTFRVCGRAEEAETWSPWSIPQSAITTLPHHGRLLCSTVLIPPRHHDIIPPGKVN